MWLYVNILVYMQLNFFLLSVQILVSLLTVVCEVLVLSTTAVNKSQNVFALLSMLLSGLAIYMISEGYKKRGKAGANTGFTITLWRRPGITLGIDLPPRRR